ncbi:MAG: FAD-binding oxidoreductase [Candidatus Sumerlaeota bacterium]|nr:FAD-binding oxidoreductase [Candidatus Sumerlaeota bacterium]
MIFQTRRDAEKMEFLRPFDDSFQKYLSDESRLTGRADWLSLPRTENEILQTLSHAKDKSIPVTISGGRTGLTGGAVPNGGLLLSLENMNRILEIGHDAAQGEWFVRVEPGVTLSELFLCLEKHTPPLFYPPDPTEHSAFIGGTVASNASGARTFGYGSTRPYIRRLKVALMNGEVLDIARGRIRADNNNILTIPLPARNLSLRIPSYSLPHVKNTAGYFTSPAMDLIDLFIGSEGTLGVFTEIELRLLPKPPFIIGIMLYLPSEESALQFMRSIRIEPIVRPQALEFFDSHALDLLREKREEIGQGGVIPPIPDSARHLIYYERLYDDERMTDNILGSLAKILPDCGISLDDSWVELDEKGVARMKDLRHALPETVNSMIAGVKVSFPNITKLGTDFAVPESRLEEMMRLYHARLDESRLRYVIFGHIGDNHLHVNIIPRSEEEYALGKRIYEEFAAAAVRMGGTVAAEHGIGKLKKSLLRLMLGEHGIVEMERIKHAFDPAGLLNPGNMF